MRHLVALGLTLSVLAASPVFADAGHAGHGSPAAAPAGAQAGFTEGVVKKVDKAAAKVTLSHGPLENLGMPGMTMAFSVQEPAWLDRFQAGDKVRFRAERVNGVYTVVRMDAAK